MPLLPLVRPTYTPTDGMQQPRSTLREPGLGLYLLVMNNRDKLDKVRERLQTAGLRSEEHTSELQSQSNLVCRLLLAKKNAEDAVACPIQRADRLLRLFNPNVRP